MSIGWANISDPLWANAAHSAIRCMVLFSHLPEQVPVPFTAAANDSTAHGVAIFNECAAGLWGAVADYVAPPEPVPGVTSDRQFFQQLAAIGAITPAEALAAVRTGDIPAALQAIIDQLPPADKFSAEMLLSGAVSFRRDHALTAQLGAAMGWTSEQVDDLWRAAALL